VIAVSSQQPAAEERQRLPIQGEPEAADHSALLVRSDQPVAHQVPGERGQGQRQRLATRCTGTGRWQHECQAALVGGGKVDQRLVVCRGGGDLLVGGLAGQEVLVPWLASDLFAHGQQPLACGSG
jgi:hypothetical protein